MKCRTLSIVAAFALLTVVTSSAQAMYHARMGRFIQRDPHGTTNPPTALRVGMTGPAAAGGFVARDPMPTQPEPDLQYVDGMNLYQYVRSQPVSALDPMGLYTIGGEIEKYCNKKCTSESKAGRRCRSNCRKRFRGIAGRKRAFNLWYKAEAGDTAWIAKIPKCPDSICLVNGKPQDCTNGEWNGLSEASQEFHPGAQWCMRSKSYDGHAQQCCFDKSGNLIKSGLGAGTPDREAASFWNGIWISHYRHDVRPYNWADEFDGGKLGPYLKKYLEVRPPSQGGGGCYTEN